MLLLSATKGLKIQAENRTKAGIHTCVLLVFEVRFWTGLVRKGFFVGFFSFLVFVVFGSMSGMESSAWFTAACEVDPCHARENQTQNGWV